MRRFYLLCVLCLCSSACNRPADAAAQPHTQQDAIIVVDSIFPMDVMIARFQARMPRRVHDLGNAPTSRDELVVRLVRAVADSSAAALRALRLDAAEYAYVYFPSSRWATDPYRQPPELAWLMTEQNGLKGEARLLRHYGGTSLPLIGYRCEDVPTIEGENRLWEHCTVRVTSRTSPIRLFGSMLEHRGRYKFVSIANDL